jgi:hypothetical protein
MLSQVYRGTQMYFFIQKKGHLRYMIAVEVSNSVLYLQAGFKTNISLNADTYSSNI